MLGLNSAGIFDGPVSPAVLYPLTFDRHWRLSPTKIYCPFLPAHFRRLPVLALLYQSTRVSLIFINVASSRYTAITISHYADLCRHYRRCAKDGKEPDRPACQPSAQGSTYLLVSDNLTRHSEAQVRSRPLFIAFSARQSLDSAVEVLTRKEHGRFGAQRLIHGWY